MPNVTWKDLGIGEGEVGMYSNTTAISARTWLNGLFVMGGVFGELPEPTVLYYDIESNRFSKRNEFNIPRYDCASCLVEEDGKEFVYAIGGHSPDTVGRMVHHLIQ